MEPDVTIKYSSVMDRLVIFCDGTWCGPEYATRTNIQILAEMTGIDMATSKGSREFIDPARRLRAKYFNGLNCNYLTYALGAPPDNVEQLCLDIYHYITKWYTAGAEIWLFGLGRGAYALRCVVGMINNCGIVKDPSFELSEMVYRVYMSPRVDDRPSSPQSREFRQRLSWDVKTPVKIMVLLDTFGSIDTPSVSARSTRPTIWDEALPTTVETVFHACSVHDRLSLLQPCLVTKVDHSTLPHIKEVWFPGCHYDIGRQSCQIFPGSWPYWIPGLLTGTVKPNHVLSNVVLCWILKSVSRAFPFQNVFQDIHWQISFLKKMTSTTNQGIGSGDVYGPERTLLYAPFGRVLTRLPFVPRAINVFASMSFGLKDRRIPSHSAEVIDFQTSDTDDHDCLVDLARINASRYPSRTHELWKKWTGQDIIEGKAISWSVGLADIPHDRPRVRQIEHESAETVGWDHNQHCTDRTRSTSEKHDNVRIRQHLASHETDLPLDALSNALSEAVMSKDTTLVLSLLHQRTDELAFDFEWLSELLELGHDVADIAEALIAEESASPWLSVSGGNFSKRTLKLARRLARKRGTDL